MLLDVVENEKIVSAKSENIQVYFYVEQTNEKKIKIKAALSISNKFTACTNTHKNYCLYVTFHCRSHERSAAKLRVKKDVKLTFRRPSTGMSLTWFDDLFFSLPYTSLLFSYVITTLTCLHV